MTAAAFDPDQDLIIYARREDALTADAERARDPDNWQSPVACVNSPSPLELFTTQTLLRDLRLLHEGTGQSRYFFSALNLSVQLGLPTPQWVVDTLAAGEDMLRHFEVGSLDEAFGRPYRKGAKIPDLKVRAALGPAIVAAIRSKLLDGAGRTKDLWAEVGELFGVSPSTVESIYGEHRAELSAKAIEAYAAAGRHIASVVFDLSNTEGAQGDGH